MNIPQLPSSLSSYQTSSGSTNKILQRILTCAFLMVIVACSAIAQTGTGSIKGTVTDELGGLIVNERVVAKDSKGVEITVMTSASGSYEFANLAPGNYELRVAAKGFSVLVEKNVTVRSGRATTTDLQVSVGLEQETVTVDEKGVSTDADRNADARILRGADLEALPNDPQALATSLQAMAGPSAGENGPQVKVDGFSNGQIPPKEAIREVRINQNPYSAENEYPGYGGIEIYTQPGSEKWHGSTSFGFNDESLNSRNPFTLRRAPYQQRSYGVSLSGPIIPKRASFSLYAGRYSSDSNSVVNATILDPVTLKPVLFSQSLVTPQVAAYVTLRGDLKINKKNTLVGSMSYSQNSQDLQGIGGFSLPSRAYRGKSHDYTFQLTETAVLNEKTVNETRLQIIRSSSRQTSVNALPGLNVIDSFFGGGSQTGAALNRQDRIELQNFTSLVAGHHFLKVGGRVRNVRVESISPSNFGGTYTFAGGTGPRLDANDQVILVNGQPHMIEINSLERYRRTLLFGRQGLSASAIRNLGGGATQLSIAGGNPEAGVHQTDIGFYVQDEWKFRPNLTVSPGLRYESQTNINSDFNFAPRLGFAWSPFVWQKKVQPPKPTPTNAKTDAQVKSTPTAPAPAAAPAQSKTVIRGGIGLFYNRISEDLTLQAFRSNGINQQQFVVTDPSVLDLFPNVPPVAFLNSFSQPLTRRIISPDLDPSNALRASISIERQLRPNLNFSLNYSHTRSSHTMRTVNINAPIAGTYNPAVPSSGVRPLGQSAGNILESESNGRTISNSINVSINGQIKKLSFWSSYGISKSKSRDNGTSGSSFDPYDFSGEWGRSAYDTRHFFYLSGNYQGPLGIGLNTFIIATSGRPFNITIGHDLNGDTFFSERPAFATDLNKPGVVVTPFGAFDPNPTPGQRIIPRNFGQGPGTLSVNFGLSKDIKFGRAIQSQAVTAPATVSAEKPASSQKPPARPPVKRPYSLSFSIYASNALNHVNLGNPVGNLASPYFLKSTSTSNSFSFGPGGSSGGNRQISLRIRLSF